MTPVQSQRKRALPFVALLLVIFAAVPAAWLLFLQEPEPPPPPPPPVAEKDAGRALTAVRLAQVQGTVEIRKGASGEWAVAKEGDLLSPNDGVRTRDGSYAVMVGEEYWEVKMEPGTEVGIGDLSESITRLLFANGMARATVRGGGRHSFEVRSTTGDATASTDAGVFTMAGNGKGTVAIGTEEGEVRLVGKGRVVIVRAGQQSIVHAGQAPSDPTPIPNSLLLKVALPAASTVNRPKVVLRGQVEPGTQLEVQGRVVQADDKGRFEAQVPLMEGKNSVEVRARGVGGQTATSTHAVELDTTVKAPVLDKNLWK